MWFDARAALARIEGGTDPAPEALAQPNSQNSQESHPPAVQSRNLTASPAPAQFAEVAGFATTRPPNPASPDSRGNPGPLSDTVKRRAAALPSKPETCAACGVADWHVSLTDTNRRKLHVACWRAEHVGRAKEYGGR